MTKFAEYQAVISTPFATLGLKLDQASVRGLDFIFDDIKTPIFKNEFAEHVAEQINFYLADPRYRFDIKVLAQGTVFQKSVWLQMRAIPSGQCFTYSEVADNLNSGARAVGNACRKNPIPLIIPCHRVVAKNGIGGFAGETSGPLMSVKKWLLAHESSAASFN